MKPLHICCWNIDQFRCIGKQCGDASKIKIRFPNILPTVHKAKGLHQCVEEVSL